MQPSLIDHESVIRNIQAFIDSIPMKAPMYLHVWSDMVCITSAGAAVLAHRIRHAFPNIDGETLQTEYNWRQLAYLAGVDNNWDGYKGN